MASSVSGVLEPLITTDELAEILKVSPRTLDSWAYKGVGPRAIRVGRHRRYRPQDVRRFLDERAGEGSLARRKGTA